MTADGAGARDRRLRWAALVAGTGLSLVLVARSQVGLDQWNLLARGWLLAFRGVWVPYGNPASDGGYAIGGFTSLIVGVPLFLWRDFRAPALLTALTHLAAYLLLDDVVRRAGGRRERLWFAFLYWLNPWRLYFSGHLWNVNFLFLAGAVHVWTAVRMRTSRRGMLTFVHVAVVGFAAQLHPSAAILAAATVILMATRQVRLHPGGAVPGVALFAGSLVPWFHAVARSPDLVPGSGGFVGRGLVTLVPVARGLWSLIRYGSFAVANTMQHFDFSAAVGPDVDRWLAPAAVWTLRVLAAVTVVPSAIALVWFARRTWRRRRAVFRKPAGSARRWLDAYLGASLAATLVAICLSPASLMYWDFFVVFHVVVLVVIRWLDALATSARRAVRVRRAAAAFAAAAVTAIIAMAFGSPHYRCEGRWTLVLPLREHYAMIDDLAIERACEVPVDPDGGWGPDVFR